MGKEKTKAEKLAALKHPEIEKTMAEFRAWCDVERGRQTEIAKRFDVTRSSVNGWLKRTANPAVKTFFELRDFLKAQKGKK
jgi:transcriptional regulator with XRE-family HTH domain